MDEQSLILRSQAGDIEAFNELVEQYQRLVYNVAYRMLGDAGIAEDITQDTFLSAYRAIPRFKGSSIKGWLIRIATNRCHDYFRRNRRSRSVSLENLLMQTDLVDMTDKSESPEDYATRLELGRVLNVGLACLPEEQRLIVILHDVQELSYEEVAEVVGCSLGTVKSRLNRGRNRLKQFLREKREHLPPEFRLDR